MGRYAKADDIAAQIAFLCSPAAAAITGAALMADSGYTLGPDSAARIARSPSRYVANCGRQPSSALARAFETRLLSM